MVDVTTPKDSRLQATPKTLLQWMVRAHRLSLLWQDFSGQGSGQQHTKLKTSTRAPRMACRCHGEVHITHET
jgi:hypothetical protein